LPPEETLLVLPWAREANCLVNAASLAGQGDWALVAQFDVDCCRIGIGTGGTDPGLARKLKKILLRHLTTDHEVDSQ
jgi:siroheme synthase (precorrin-2 oxidase/ferrochelatase)